MAEVQHGSVSAELSWHVLSEDDVNFAKSPDPSLRSGQALRKVIVICSN